MQGQLLQVKLPKLQLPPTQSTELDAMAGAQTIADRSCQECINLLVGIVPATHDAWSKHGCTAKS